MRSHRRVRAAALLIGAAWALPAGASSNYLPPDTSCVLVLGWNVCETVTTNCHAANGICQRVWTVWRYRAAPNGPKKVPGKPRRVARDGGHDSPPAVAASAATPR